MSASASISSPRSIVVNRLLPDKILVRTSYRSLYRKCRRLWGWMSPNKANLDIRIRPDYFWIGTGMHFAMEDFHGYNYYGHPAAAFIAYYEATRKAGTAPIDCSELLNIGTNMMVYYKDYWLDYGERDPLETYYVRGVPQVEVRFLIPLPIKGPQGQEVFYQGTFDGIVIDEDERLWIKEYKSAKAIQKGHFDVDDQCTSYVWAARQLYDLPIAGVIYQQHKKAFPSPPKLLRTGKLSTSKTMSTTASLYARKMAEVYGMVSTSPVECRKYLENLQLAECSGDFTTGDKYIQRDYIYRNEYQAAAQGEKILMEVEEQLREDLPLYPSPTRDCNWMCPLESACIAMDDGSDYESLLMALTQERPEENDEWRKHLPLTIPEIPEESLLLAPIQENLEDKQQETKVAAQQDSTELFLESLGMGL